MPLILDEEKAEQQAEPSWFDLHNGAALLCVPPTSALLSAAESMAEAVMVDLAASHEAVTRVGGRIVGTIDLSNEAAVEGTRQTLVLVSLMELTVRDWRGILGTDRKPIKFRPSLLALLLSDVTVCRAIERRYLKPLHEVVAEGNVSGRSPSGTSGSAGEKRTATGARRRAPLAQRPARKTAPTTRKPH